jgi:hypothetical protein
LRYVAENQGSSVDGENQGSILAEKSASGETQVPSNLGIQVLERIREEEPEILTSLDEEKKS